ncbi:MAG: hypothetical protein IKW90_07655 [Lachnospiraceae bacterium]|nr:hypothetical protein [Lachnospiraceae bacterium]
MSNYIPMNYHNINVGAGTYSPSPVKAYNNRHFAYWIRALFQRATSVIEFDLPEDWSGSVKDFFLYCLYRFGYVVIFDHDTYGRMFQPCTLSGYNAYYQPTNAIIANPRFEKSLDLKIGEECELLKLTPDYVGIWDVLEYYAERFSTLDDAINMSLINCKTPYILGAKNKTASSALKKILDLVNKGEPAVVFDEKLMNDPNSKDTPFQLLELLRDPKSAYLTTDQLADFRTILDNFDAEIGIPCLPYQKKERLVSDEATMRTYDGSARSLTWFNTLTASIDQIKKLYPDITLEARLHYADFNESEGVSDNE